MKPKIAVSIAAPTAKEASTMTRRARRLGADLAEIRLDYLKQEESVETVAKSREIPLIATFRSIENGGVRDVAESKRMESLLAAARAGFQYVDIELKTRNLTFFISKLHAAGAETIVSHHDFKKTDSEAKLKEVLNHCRRSGATLTKLVTTATKMDDSLRLLALTQEESKRSGLICFGMGRLGIQSRIFSPLYGAVFTLASLDDEKTVAPGQIPVSRMRRIYMEMGYS